MTFLFYLLLGIHVIALICGLTSLFVIGEIHHKKIPNQLKWIANNKWIYEFNKISMRVFLFSFLIWLFLLFRVY